jgi:hypothetical protein
MQASTVRGSAAPRRNEPLQGLAFERYVLGTSRGGAELRELADTGRSGPSNKDTAELLQRCERAAQMATAGRQVRIQLS